MKIPFSRQIADYALIPFGAVGFVGFFDYFFGGEKRIVQNVVFFAVFAPVTLLLLWVLLDNRFEFRPLEKVRASERLVLVPFPSFSCVFIFMVSTFMIVAGIAILVSKNAGNVDVMMLAGGVATFILTALAHEHPRVWFSDTLNLDDMLADALEKSRNKPDGNDSPQYQDGVFSYFEGGFQMKITNKLKSKRNKNASISALWTDIERIIAYKEDLMTFDLIIIGVQLRHRDSEDTFFECTDEIPGSLKFMETAAEHLPNFRRDWYMAVAFPAFETNLTLVYERRRGEDSSSLTAVPE